ncbi:expressed unknown protein [Seminavis robusta]|uniref:Uncharacterized protein n=1 Tax=Seminavis robusta TaxID=568900 RepID=A0A9N8EH17_9STRA|nr:expressed unknown protein [Seminavis robusta]|eukprot:Sro1152_g246860.1 n/a (96) ;mRNA; r:10528-10815
MSQQQQQQQSNLWQQWAASAPEKRSTSSLLDDDEDEQVESVMQHMQLPGMAPRADECAFLPPFSSSPSSLQRSDTLRSVESGALPMVALRRCNHS